MENNLYEFLNVCKCGCEDTCLKGNKIVCANCEKEVQNEGHSKIEKRQNA